MEDPLVPVRANMSRLFTGLKQKKDEWLALEVLEGAVLGLFDLFTPEQLCQAIMEDIPIWGTHWGNCEQFRFQFQLLSKDMRFVKHSHMLTAENVLTWLTDDDARPLLAGVIINTPGGPDWLVRQVEAVKTGLLEPTEEEEAIVESQG